MQRAAFLTFVSSLTCQRPSASFRRFAEVVNSTSDLVILNYGLNILTFPPLH